MSSVVNSHNRIISTVGIHIVAGVALAGGDIAVSINKPASDGVVVTGVEVIKSGFGVVVIAAVAEGVVHADSACGRAGNGNACAPCVGVGILHYKLIRGVVNSRYVALEILAEDVIEAVYTHTHGSAALVVIVPNDSVVIFSPASLVPS